jgi:hypothetical protein
MGAGGADDASGQAQVTCSCCSHRACKDASAPDDDPSAPADDGGCESCLCHGALVKQDPFTLDLDRADAPLFVVAALPAPSIGASTNASLLDASRESALHLAAGMRLRVLHQSFLL